MLEPIRILLDARKLGDGGIGVYIENLVDGLLKLEDLGLAKPRLTLLVPHEFFKDSSLSTHFKTNGQGAVMRACQMRWLNRVRFVAESAPKYSFREFFLLAWCQKAECQEHDIFHSPHYTLPYFLGIPSVVTIHDTIHLSHPETFYHRPVANFLIRSALKRAQHVLTVSKESARCLEPLALSYHVPVSVVPNALRPTFVRQSEAKVEDYLRREFITRKYCLYVGSERQHKGFWELLEAWSAMKQSQKDVPDLLVVGRNFNSAKDKVLEKGLDNLVRFVGEVSLDKLALLYSGASAVLVPSKVEGFGLPALEGMGLGVPVVCAPIPSLREVCGGAALYPESNSAEAWSETIMRLFTEPGLAEQKQAEGLERAECFSAEVCAQKTWEVYSRVLGRDEQRGSADSAELQLANCC